MLKTAEVAEALRLSAGHVRKLAREKRIRSYKVGAGERSEYRFRLAEVLEDMRHKEER